MKTLSLLVVSCSGWLLACGGGAPPPRDAGFLIPFEPFGPNGGGPQEVRRDAGPGDAGAVDAGERDSGAMTPDAGATPVAGALGPVRLSFSNSQVLNRPLAVCLMNQVRAHQQLAADVQVGPRSFTSIGYLVWNIRSTIDPVFTQFAANRMLLSFEWLTPLTEAEACPSWQFGAPYPESCVGLFRFGGEMVLSFEAATGAGWTFFDEAGTSLRSHAETSLIVSPTPVLVRDASASSWRQQTLDLSPCSRELVEPI